jgi:hypothetical protein
MKKKPPQAVVLDKSDWEEIAAAIEIKIAKLKRGDYGTCMEHDEKKGECHCTAEWSCQLESILNRIGGDGELATKAGVAPVPA